MYECINCTWSGEDAKKPLNHCPICGDNTIILGEIIGKERKEIPKSTLDRIKDFTTDVLDDGKRNYSNRKPKTKKSKKGR